MIKTAKQQLQTDILADPNVRELLCSGGASAGKTFNIVYDMVMRCLLHFELHLITRKYFSSLNRSILKDTLPAVLSLPEFKGLAYKINKNDQYIEFEATGARIMFIGLDNKTQRDKILGTRFATIFVNELSEVSEDDYELLKSRLLVRTTIIVNGKEVPVFKAYIVADQNPGPKSHWAYRNFVELLDKNGKPHKAGTIMYLQMNPADNRENLTAAYFENLDTLSTKQKQRFLLGEWQSNTDGALWTHELIIQAKALADEDKFAKDGALKLKRVVIGIDPSVSDNKTSDLCGIIVVGEYDKYTKVMKDFSYRASPNTWANKVVNLYHSYGAETLVLETNQGGKSLGELIKKIDPSVKIKEVFATKSKVVRAEPIVALYERNLIAHEQGLEALEEELMSYVPPRDDNDGKAIRGKSPDRMDALVWALNYVELTKKRKVRFAYV